MKISGHKRQSVLDRYNLRSEDDLCAAVKRLNRYIQGKRGTFVVTPEVLRRKASLKCNHKLLTMAEGARFEALQCQRGYRSRSRCRPLNGFTTFLWLLFHTFDQHCRRVRGNPTRMPHHPHPAGVERPPANEPQNRGILP